MVMQTWQPKMFERPHPSGYDGIRSSLDAVVDRIREGRKNPKVRAWVGKQLIAAGNPKGHVARAQAIFDAMKKQNIWVPDPRGVEMMAGAHVTLGDGENPPEMPAGDCDDLTIAYLSACESVGIPTAVVGAAYDEAANISHVLGMITDGQGAWYYADPSTEFPFGEAKKATHEEVIDVATGKRICVAATCSIPLRGERMPEQGAGSFVSVDGLPDGTLGDAAQQLTDDQRASLSMLSAQLGRSWSGFVDAYHTMRDVFSMLGVAPPGADGNIVWTPAVEQFARDLQSMVSIARAALDEGAAGMRQVAMGQWESGPLKGVADVFVARLPQDGYYVALNDNGRPTIYDAKTQQPVLSQNAVSGWPLLIGIGLASAAVISWAVAFAIDSSNSNATRQAEIAFRDARNKREMDALAAGTLTPAQLEDLRKVDARIAEYEAKKAAEQPNPIKDAGKGIGEAAVGVADMLKGAALFAAVLGVGYVGFQVYQGRRGR